HEQEHLAPADLEDVGLGRHRQRADVPERVAVARLLELVIPRLLEERVAQDPLAVDAIKERGIEVSGGGFGHRLSRGPGSRRGCIYRPRQAAPLPSPPYFPPVRSRTLMSRNQTSSPWSWSAILPLGLELKSGYLVHLLSARAVFQASLAVSVSTTLNP